jgi:transcriptional regulator with XRE-family HTH domain
MTYEQFIAKARKGRTVAALAEALGMQKMTLNRYMRGDRLPDYETALMLAREADITPGEVMILLAEEERRRKATKEIISTVFRLLTNAWNRLSIRLTAI